MKKWMPVLSFLSLTILAYSSYAQEDSASRVNGMNPPRFGGGPDRGGGERRGPGDGGFDRGDDRRGPLRPGPDHGGGRWRPRPPRPYPRPNPGYPEPGYGRDTIENIRCSSDHYRYSVCSTRSPGYIVDFRLIQQQSRTACIYGRTYGATNSYIWVDQGCDGVFQVTTRF